MFITVEGLEVKVSISMLSREIIRETIVNTHS